MLARQHDPPVDLAQIAKMFCPRGVAPLAVAAEREWHAVPAHRDAVVELGPVLRMDLAPNSTALATRSVGVIAVNS